MKLAMNILREDRGLFTSTAIPITLTFYSTRIYLYIYIYIYIYIPDVN